MSATADRYLAEVLSARSRASAAVTEKLGQTLLADFRQAMADAVGAIEKDTESAMAQAGGGRGVLAVGGEIQLEFWSPFEQKNITVTVRRKK